MGYYDDITKEQIDKLSKLVAKYMKIDIDDAVSIIYDEYDLVEELFNSCKKIKDVAKKFAIEVNELYKIA